MAIKNQFGLKLKVWKSYNYVISQKIGLYRVPEIDSNSSQWMEIKNQYGLFSTIDVNGIKRNYNLETVKSVFQNKNCRVPEFDVNSILACVRSGQEINIL